MDKQIADAPITQISKSESLYISLFLTGNDQYIRWIITVDTADTCNRIQFHEICLTYK